MSIDNITNREEDAVAVFKVKNLSFTTLELYSIDLMDIDVMLQQKMAQGPEFFKGAPILLDLKNVDHEVDINWLEQVMEKVASCGFIPIGVTGVSSKSVRDNALLQGIAVWPSKRERESEPDVKRAGKKVDTTVADDRVSEKAHPALIVQQPVRSGQRIYAKGRDLVVMSSVNTGAEIMADGHIHIYGSLRGRALAGTDGWEEARIFCHDLQAELVAVAGYYLTYEDFPDDSRNSAVQISLQEQKICITPLESR